MWVCQMISGSRYGSILIVITTITKQFLSEHVRINLKNFWLDGLILCLEIINIFHVAPGGFGSFGLMNIFWKEDYIVGLKYQSLDSTCVWWMMVLGWIYFSNFPININTALILSSGGSVRWELGPITAWKPRPSDAEDDQWHSWAECKFNLRSSF